MKTFTLSDGQVFNHAQLVDIIVAKAGVKRQTALDRMRKTNKWERLVEPRLTQSQSARRSGWKQLDAAKRRANTA